MKANEVFDMIFWIKNTYPRSIKFKIDDYTLNVIHAHIRTNHINLLIGGYGIDFTLACLSYCEYVEDYERCRSIKDGIEKYNKDFNLQFPTHLISV